MRKATVSNDHLETLDWLATIRWDKGPVCQACHKKNISKMIRTRGLYQCRDCRKQFSVFSGTRFEGTRLSPMKLSIAIIEFWRQSCDNYESFYANKADMKAKKVSSRWKGTIGVRALARAIGTYSTAQRLHKKLSATPFSPQLGLEKYISQLLK